jgi:hypothetical protein
VVPDYDLDDDGGRGIRHCSSVLLTLNSQAPDCSQHYMDSELLETDIDLEKVHISWPLEIHKRHDSALSSVPSDPAESFSWIEIPIVVFWG